MNRTQTILLLAALALLASIQAGHAAIVYDADSQFSLASNPNGVWSYTANGALMTQSTVEPNGELVRSNAGGVAPTTLSSVYFNPTAATLTDPPFNTVFLAPGLIGMDPEGVSDATMLFTAPSAGLYSISGSVTGIDTGEQSHTFQINKNGSSVFSATIHTFNQSVPFSLSESLNAGDTIAFVNRTGANSGHLSVSLSAAISVPEPSCSVLLALGGVPAVVAMWRTAKRARRTKDRRERDPA